MNGCLEVEPSFLSPLIVKVVVLTFVDKIDEGFSTGLRVGCMAADPLELAIIEALLDPLISVAVVVDGCLGGKLSVRSLLLVEDKLLPFTAELEWLLSVGWKPGSVDGIVLVMILCVLEVAIVGRLLYPLVTAVVLTNVCLVAEPSVETLLLAKMPFVERVELISSIWMILFVVGDEGCRGDVMSLLRRLDCVLLETLLVCVICSFDSTAVDEDKFEAKTDNNMQTIMISLDDLT